MRLDKRTDWDAMQERAERHFAKRAALNTAPRERMAAHPCPERVRESEAFLCEVSRQYRRAVDNTLGAMRAAEMQARRERNFDR